MNHSLRHEGAEIGSPPSTLQRTLWGVVIAVLFLTALWAALGSPAVVWAEPVRQIGASGALAPLAIPDPTADVTMTSSFFSQFGFAVSGAGDVNDDGVDDLLVGADGANMAYIYTGSVVGPATTPFAALGPYEGRFGTTVAGGGNFLRDLDGDGIDDFLVGAPFAAVESDSGGVAPRQVIIPDVGMVYVFSGRSDGPPTLAVRLTGEASADRFGSAIALAGDLNGDGYGDVVVGAFQNGEAGGLAGKVYLYYGRAGGLVNVPDLTITGESANDKFGFAVAGLGDVNGDGYDDIAVGAIQHTGGGVDAGKVYIYYGSATGINPDNKTTLPGTTNQRFGSALHAAGDVNGDGYADLIVGSDPFNPAVGRADVFLGGPSGIFPTPAQTYHAEGESDRFGLSVGGGDLNNDGFSDVLVGAYEFSDELAGRGKALAYGGCVDGPRQQPFFATLGDTAGENHSRSLAVAGDLNGDGYADLVAGAWSNDENGFNSGKVYLYYGGPVDLCNAQIAVNRNVGLADYPPVCGPSAAVPTSTKAITVPINTAIAYCYTVENTSNVTLTHHFLADDGAGLGDLLVRTQITLTPGMTYTHVVTRLAPITPGIELAGTITWTAIVSVTAPGGAPAIPPDAVVSAVATDSGEILISPDDLDQDGDGVPDNQEGAGDANGNGIPAYLDPDEFPETPDPEGASLFLPTLLN